MISILLPTRGRPKEFERMLTSIRATEKNRSQVIGYLDDDDDAFGLYPTLSEPDCYLIGPRIILTDCWNKCLREARGDIYMQCNDDVVFKTPEWDVMVENAFAEYLDKILFVHGSDEGQHFANFGAHGFVHKKWVDRIGYFIPPYFCSDFGDTWLNDVANALNRRKYLPFVVEHLHPLFGKAPTDKTYQERLARHATDHPDELYYSEGMVQRRKEDVDKLRVLMR